MDTLEKFPRPADRQRLVTMPGNFRGSRLLIASLVTCNDRSAILEVIPAADTRPRLSGISGVESAQIEAIPKRSASFLGRINGTDLLHMICFVF
jgi:hypothetical protein